MARAAIDFGYFEMAEIELEKLIIEFDGKTGDGRSSRIYEEAAKSYFILGDLLTGTELFNESKKFWAEKGAGAKLSRLHEISLWQAQFYCSEADISKARDFLEEATQAIANYEIGPSRTSRLIEVAYASCLAILETHGFKPQIMLPVPNHYRIRDANGEWVFPVVKPVRSSKLDSQRSTFGTNHSVRNLFER